MITDPRYKDNKSRRGKDSAGSEKIFALHCLFGGFRLLDGTCYKSDNCIEGAVARP